MELTIKNLSIVILFIHQHVSLKIYLFYNQMYGYFNGCIFIYYIFVYYIFIIYT